MVCTIDYTTVYLIRTLQDREVPSIWYSILSMAILYVAVYFAVKRFDTNLTKTFKTTSFLHIGRGGFI